MADIDRSLAYISDPEQTERIFSVQRARPFGPIGPRKTIVLPVDQIHPVIRIAHRLAGQMTQPERIIFDYELVLILSGSGALRTGKTAIEFGPHDLLFISPFVPHRFASSSPDAEHIAIHFDFAREVPAYDERLDERAPYQVRLTHLLGVPQRVRLSAGHRIEQSLTDLVREYHSADPTGPLAAVSLLMQSLAWLFRHAANENEAISPRNHEQVMRAAAFVEENLQRPISTADMAAAAGLSSSRLHALFRLVLGVTPHDHVINARISRARILLSNPQLSIKEIASRTGFEDSYHFSRVFRRVDGLPPTRYRDALLRSGQ